MRIDPQRIIRLGVLIQHGSFGKAAAYLGLTQPALSQSIALIEREIGVKVVERTQHGVVPTIYGQVLYEHAKTIDRELAQAARQIQDLASGREDTLSVGTIVGGAATLAAQAICALHDTRPGIDTRIHEDFSIKTLLTQLRDRTVDLVVCHRPPEADLKGLKASPLFRTRRVACVRSGHPLPETATLQELSAYPFVCPPDELGLIFGLPQIFSTIGSEMPRILVADSIYVAKELVLNSEAFALVSAVSLMDEQQSGRLKIIEIDVPTMYWMQLVRREDQVPTDLMNEFVAKILTICDERQIDTRKSRDQGV